MTRVFGPSPLKLQVTKAHDRDPLVIARDVGLMIDEAVHRGDGVVHLLSEPFHLNLDTCAQPTPKVRNNDHT